MHRSISVKKKYTDTLSLLHADVFKSVCSVHLNRKATGEDPGWGEKHMITVIETDTLA